MTTKRAESVKNERLIKKLVIGAAAGALVGLALGYVWAQVNEQGRLPIGQGRGSGPKRPIKPNEILKLGVSLLAIARQVSDLANKT